ncbi:MAG: protein kinase [Nitrospirae bacterium]|nr:protein kinase [Nitrospirota bacterium]
MPAKVVLEVTEGKLKGKKYKYLERTTCIIGRGVDCSPRLPDDDEHRTISRHHCLLDINPPGIRIKDFGSLNGTYVNGMKIGQRQKTQDINEISQLEFPEYDLKKGDEIKLGSTVFKVKTYESPTCSVCGSDLPFDNIAEYKTKDGSYICKTCTENKTQKDTVTPLAKCTGCGKTLSKDSVEQSSGLCTVCRDDPMQVVKSLVPAEEKDKDTLEIHGYKILKEIGKGGMGAVYLAKHIETGRDVALKVMLSEVAVNERSKEMFLREVENTKHLKHPNVVQLLDYGNSRGTFYFTLEYCEGGSIDKIMMAQGGRLSVEEATNMILQSLDGLHYAHTLEIPNVKLADASIVTLKGLIHRDIKPTNIFLTEASGTRLTKIADFGLGKAFDAAGLSGYTRTGASAGTPVFMSRQQVINFKYSKPEADVWAMAATFYYMLTGRFPRDFPKGKDPWYIVLQSKPVPILKRNPNIPKKLAEVIDEALIDQPEIKIKTALDFKRALEGAL